MRVSPVTPTAVVMPAVLRPADVQQENNNCALAAATLSVMHTAPSVLQTVLQPVFEGNNQRLCAGLFVRKHTPTPCTHDVPALAKIPTRGAAWWRALQMAVAQHNAAHGGDAQQTLPHAYLTTLTGVPAYAHPCDVRNKAYLFSLVVRAPAMAGIAQADARALDAWYKTHAPTVDSLQAQLDPHAPFTLRALDTWAGHVTLPADLYTAVRAVLHAPRSKHGVPAWVTQYLGNLVAEKLQNRAFVCVSTRKRLSLRDASWRRIAADVGKAMSSPGYAASWLLGGLAGGVQAQHAYAIIAMKPRPSYRAQLATGGQVFWIDFGELLRHTAGLYFSRHTKPAGENHD